MKDKLQTTFGLVIFMLIVLILWALGQGMTLARSIVFASLILIVMSAVFYIPLMLFHTLSEWWRKKRHKD